MTLANILILYLAFRAKQLTCDFFLQTAWMANVKGNPFNMGGAKALLAHAGIHAAGTLIVMFFLAPAFWWLALVDFCVHGCIDKIKGAVTNKYGWTYKDTAYWWAFGIDQEAHNLTHLAYIVTVVLSSGAALH